MRIYSFCIFFVFLFFWELESRKNRVEKLYFFFFFSFLEKLKKQTNAERSGPTLDNNSIEEEERECVSDVAVYIAVASREEVFNNVTTSAS